MLPLEESTKLGNLLWSMSTSRFFKRKYNIGCLRETQWVLGKIERGSGRCILKRIPDRSARTILPIMENHILPGSTIMTDCWASYARLDSNEFFTHLSVNHSVNFVNPEDSSINTQTIENCWMLAKKETEKDAWVA